MRIAVISAHTCPLAALGGKETGGMNVYVRETCRELGNLGIAVDIFTRSQDPEIPREVALDRGVRVFHIPAGPESPYDKYCFINHLREFIDGVLVHGGQGYDLIHSHYWLSGMAALELRERWRAPVVHMYHTLGFLKNRVARNRYEQERAIRIQWEWEIARRVDALVASHPLERALLIWHYDAVPDRVQVIPCGVDLSLFRPIEREIAHQALGLKPRPWLLFVGRLEPIKGLDTLLKAIFLLKKHGRGLSDKPALLVIGGNKDQADSPGVERELMGQVAALGLERRVFLMGSRPQVDLPFFYAASEACILPSRYESFGMVALEAMACGRPVIASRVGGLNYTVRDGVNGFLVPEGDAESLADKISLLLSDSNLRNDLGRRATERAKLFRWEKVVEILLRLYGNLLIKGERQATFTLDQYGFLEEGLGP